MHLQNTRQTAYGPGKSRENSDERNTKNDIAASTTDDDISPRVLPESFPRPERLRKDLSLVCEDIKNWFLVNGFPLPRDSSGGSSNAPPVAFTMTTTIITLTTSVVSLLVSIATFIYTVRKDAKASKRDDDINELRKRVKKSEDEIKCLRQRMERRETLRDPRY